MGYMRGFLVGTLAFAATLATAALYIPQPSYGEALIAGLVISWGFFVVLGLPGCAAAVWLIKNYGDVKAAEE